MLTDGASSAATGFERGDQDVGTLARRWKLLLRLALVLAVYVGGSPAIDAPWIQGDEFIFIARNPDVTGPADEVRSADELGRRLGQIWGKIHDDLYQPVPIASYAMEWALAGGQAGHFRRVDVVLHALNALLLWWALGALLRRFAPTPAGPVIAWAGALLWALHPALVTAYASDMGRTHLLSATFALLALESYLRALTPGRGAWFVATIAALLLAMLSKAIPGWVLVAFALEAEHFGWRRAVRSPRVWVVGLICVAFAVLTFWTTRQSGILEDASKGLFGDPVARSALAMSLYVRDLAAPLWLAFWHVPDPRTGWSYPLVWLGLLLAIASVIHAFRAARRPETQGIALGWAWCWALLLPVIGLVGAREVAAVDRYLYQPLMGIALVAAVLVARCAARWRPGVAWRVVVPVACAIGALMLMWDLPNVRIARSTIRRAARLVELNANDPRALEALAEAYDFSRNHAIPADDLDGQAPGAAQYRHFTAQMSATLTRAASVANLDYYFPRAADRGPFHRRLSYRFLLAGSPEQALAQAEEARRLLPDEFLTWKRLAHAYQALGRFDDAVDAYQNCESRLPADLDTRAVHYTDFASLLLFDLDRNAEACPRFAAVVESGRATPQARIGLALCKIRDSRYGTGVEGFAIVREILEADPSNMRAGLVLAEYHLRSHHWREAALVYEAVLQDHPAQYVALRGYHEVCLQLGRSDDAATAWRRALGFSPGERAFDSYLVWAQALAGDPEVEAAADDLLRRDADNRFACFAMMLVKARAAEWATAVEWVRRAGRGQPVAQAREFQRAAAAVQFFVAQSVLPAEAIVVQGAIYVGGEFPRAARVQLAESIGQMASGSSDSELRALAEGIRAELSDL